MIDERGKQLLAELDQYLHDSSNVQASEVYSVLTALRGPDISEIDNTKRATTGVIRYKTFPQAATMGRMGEANRDSKEDLLIRKEMDRQASFPGNYVRHFHRHVLDAFSALGLEWYEVNE